MAKAKRDVERALEQKGFVRSDGGHHRYFVYHTAAGKKTVVNTRTSHGADCALGDPLLGAMARQCLLTRRQFGQLVDCPLSRDEYELHLIAAGAVSPPDQSES